MASGPAIAASLAQTDVPAKTGADVVELVKAGDLKAIQAVRQAGRDIGEVLTTCVSLINPAVIALGGSIAASGEHLLAGVREIVYSRSMPLATEHLHIVQARAGADAGLIGAGMLAIATRSALNSNCPLLHEPRKQRRCLGPPLHDTAAGPTWTNRHERRPGFHSS